LEDYYAWRVNWQGSAYSGDEESDDAKIDNPELLSRIHATMEELTLHDSAATSETLQFTDDGITLDHKETKTAWTGILSDLTTLGYWQW